MRSNRARAQLELEIAEDSSSSEETSSSTFLVNGLKYLHQTVTRFFKRRRVRQTLAVLSATPNTFAMSIPALESLGSTAFIVGGLSAVASGFERLRQINREEDDDYEDENTPVSLAGLDDNGEELLLSPLPTRRRSVEEEFQNNLLNSTADPDFLLTMRSLAAWMAPFTPSRPQPAQALVLRRRQAPLSLGQIAVIAFELNDSVLALESLSGVEENPFLRLTASLAISILMVDWARNTILPTFQQRAFDGLNNLAVALPGQMARPQPPNPQQFFAQNYYRPSMVPRPLPPVPRNDQRLSAVKFPTDLIPAEFTCELMSTVMDTPVRLPVTKQVCDAAAILEAHARKPQNPFNRQPMDKDGPNGPQPELELRNKIGRYVDYVVDGVGNKRKELGGKALSHDDYKSVHEAAMSRLEPQNQPASTSSPGMGG